MKKVIAIALSVLLIISLLPMAAFASEKTDEVYAKMTAARDYLYGSRTGFTAAEGYDFLLYLLADGDGSQFKDAYIQSVKDAFDAGTMNTADRIAIAATCLDLLGEDTSAFVLNDSSKINLPAEMAAKGTAVDSPYNYNFVLENCEDDAYYDSVINALTAGYTKGSGYDYWGFGTDNTANFGAIMGVYGDNDELVEDAAAVVESAKTDKGYYYLAMYGTDANGNSTASALYMHSVLLDQDKADAAYDLLINNFSTENGSYCYEIDGAANTYATRDALKALIEYYNMNRLIDFINEDDEPATEKEDETVETTAAVTEQTAQKQSTPATGDSIIAFAAAGVAVIALGAALATRKKEEN